MSDKEIIEYLKTNKAIRANLQISAILNILARVVIVPYYILIWYNVVYGV